MKNWELLDLFTRLNNQAVSTALGASIWWKIGLPVQSQRRL
ncbi:MAG: hypothetical protein U0528_09260 [Anaerolineae bacterium]